MQFQTLHDLIGQDPQRAAFGIAQTTGTPIQNTQRTQRDARLCGDLSTCVKQNRIGTGDQRIIPRPNIYPRIRNLKNFFLKDGMTAHRRFQIGSMEIQPTNSFKFLIVGMHDRDKGNRAIRHLRRQLDDAIEGPPMGLGAQIITANRSKPLFLMGMNRGKHRQLP
ncbi:MAG: hypothetical protein WA873_09275 [Jannaschia helgolandensis]